GLFEDKAVTRLPWRGNNRRVRLVIYRWLEDGIEEMGLTPVQSLQQACERIVASLQACGVQSARVDGYGLYAWLLPWFNPAPRLTDEAPEDFYQCVAYPESSDGESLELPFDHDFAERLFFNEPRSDVQ
ncbi:TraC family protein, partial [Pseudomonas sp. YuFO8]